MTRRLNYMITAAVISLTTSDIFAAPSTTPLPTTSPNYYRNRAQHAQNELDNLAHYLENLGQYFGYDLTAYCQSGGPCSPTPGQSNGNDNAPYRNTLLNPNATYTLQLNLFNTFLGAIIGGTNQNNLDSTPIIPSSSNQANLINNLVGKTYAALPYNNVSNASSVSVSNLIDQQTYQADPVSQAVLNILSTPNITYCQQNNSQQFIANCPYLFRELVMNNVVGTLQGTQEVFSTDYNQPLVSQLNADTLLSPLMYSTSYDNNTSTSSNTNTNSNAGLVAVTQAQQAANLLRYVTYQVAPINLLNRSMYDKLVNVAENYSKSSSTEEQVAAKTLLNDFLLELRTYAAQISFPLSNLYLSFSKRLPQAPISGNGRPTSEALNEFIMASWRLYNSDTQTTNGNKQWLTQINQGSAASVQKEIAVLLSEINYQLYLSRQLQERMLTLQSIQALQNTYSSKPDPRALESKIQEQQQQTSS